MGEAKDFGPPDPISALRLRGWQAFPRPDGLAFGIEKAQAKALQTGPQLVIGAVPDDEAIDGFLCAEIQLPPGIVLGVRVSDGALGVIPVGSAILGTRRGGIGVLAALTGPALGREVGAFAEHLDLGELKNFPLPRQIDADIASPRLGRVRRRQEFSLNPREHKVSKARGGFRLHADGAEPGPFEGQLHLVNGAFHRSRNGDHALIPDRRPTRCLTEGFVRIRPLPGEVPGILGQPRLVALQPGRIGLGQLFFQGSNLGLETIAAGFLLFRIKGMQGSLVLAVGVGALVENSEDLKVLVLGDGVVFVAVTLGAGHGRAHPHGEGRVDAVHHGGDAKLLVAGAAFVLRHRVAVKGRGDELVLAWLGQQVPGDLFDSELVEGKVAIERLQQPVPVSPNFARLVAGVTRTVRITGQVQPERGPMLPEGGLGQQGGHIAFIGIGPLVGDKGLDFVPVRRQADEVEGEPASQGAAIRLGGGAQAFLLESRQDKVIDRPKGPGRIRHRRQCQCLRRLIGPMPLIVGPLGNPSPDPLDLLGAKTRALPRRRHHLVLILTEEPMEHLAGLRLSGHDRRMTAQVRRGALKGVEAKAGLALLLVRAMAGNAMIRDQGTNVPIEIEARLSGHGRRGRESTQQG